MANQKTGKQKYRRLESCNCHMLRRSSRLITQFYEFHLREVGIKPTQFTILSALAIKGPMGLTQLAQAIDLERTSLTRNLKIVEREGWVETLVGDDRRTRQITLTEEGYAKLNEAIPFWNNAQQKLKKVLGHGRLDHLEQDLHLLNEAVRQ